MKKFAVLLVCMIMILGAISTLTPAQAASKGITITGSTVVAKGKTVTLKADQDVTWKSSDKKIATVSSSGKVKGIKAGKVTITATAKNGKAKKSWKMTVMKKAASKVTIQTRIDSLNVGESYVLQAKASPSESAQAFTWKSSNAKVAKVTADGTVTALKEGKAKLTVTTKDGTKKTDTIVLTVIKETTERTEDDLIADLCHKYAQYAATDLYADVVYCLGELGNEKDQRYLEYFKMYLEELGCFPIIESFPQGTADFNVYLTNAISYGAKAIFCPTSYIYYALINHQVNEMGLDLPIHNVEFIENLK